MHNEPNESNIRTHVRLIDEAQRVLERRVQGLRDMITLVQQQQNRDHAHIMGTLDVVSEFIASASGISREKVRDRVQRQAAKHLDAKLANIQQKDPALAAALDDRDVDEIPTDTPLGDDAETIRRLGSNVRALWQLVALSSAHLGATKIMLRSVVAEVEKRTNDEVMAELEGLAEKEHERVILKIGDQHPDAAAALDIGKKQPPDARG